MSSLILFIAIVAIALCAHALAAWWGAIVAKSPRASLTRAMLGAVALGVINVAASSLLPTPDSPGSTVLIRFVVALGANLLLASVLFRWIFGVSAARAVLIWLFTSACSLALFPVGLFVLRPYLAETYRATTNNMAPAILGWHREAACPKCGGRAIVPALPPASTDGMDLGNLGICTQCRRTSAFPQLGGAPAAPDRFVINKRITPRRWDIVAYRPRTPDNALFLGRIAGLPGETVFVENGSVWIDGTRINPPESMAKMTYPPADFPIEPLGTRAKPITLGPSEYFHLGDFSGVAYDSRYAGPIRRENIAGVSDLCYWPLTRFRFLR